MKAYVACKYSSWDSSVGVLTGFDSWQGHDNFLFSTAYRPRLGATQPDTQWVSVALSLRVKRPGLEADHLFPSNAEVQNDGAILINMLRGFPQSFQANAAIVSQYGHDFLPYAFQFINLAIQSEIQRS